MHVNRYEKTWIYVTGALTAVMVGVLTFYAIANNIHPPSNVETIDSASLHLTAEFAEENLGVKTNADGSVTVTLVGARYGFYPRRIEVPANTPLKFRPRPWNERRHHGCAWLRVRGEHCDSDAWGIHLVLQ